MLKGRLQSVKRGNRSVTEYLQEVKSISDSLASIKERVVDGDLVMYVLNGLGRDYDNFVISVQNRENPLSFADLKAKLATHEQWLKDHHLETAAALDSVSSSAFSQRRHSHMDLLPLPNLVINHLTTTTRKATTTRKTITYIY